MKKKSQYNVDYFIKKFKAIPRGEWATGRFVDDQGKKCALGHCGIAGEMGYLTTEADALLKVVVATTASNTVASINDGYCSRYQQKYAKTRVLAALRDIKKAGL